MGLKKLGDLAAEIYGQKNVPSKEIQSLIPRFRFQFNVSIHYMGPNGEEKFISTWSADSGSKPAFRISGITLPTHAAKMSTLNQYNKKRVIQTGVEYNPVVLSAYDTRDGALEDFLLAYHQHYYNGVMYGDDAKYINDINIGERFAFGNSIYGDNSSLTGYSAPKDRNFIKKIVIERVSSPKDTIITVIHNPFIQSLEADPLSYDDNQTMQYRITFMYEGYSIGSPPDLTDSGSPTPLDKQYLDRDEAYPVTESGNPTPMWAQGPRDRYPVTESGSPTPMYAQSPSQPYPVTESGSPTPSFLPTPVPESDEVKLGRVATALYFGRQTALPFGKTVQTELGTGKKFIYLGNNAEANVLGAKTVAGESMSRLYADDIPANYKEVYSNKPSSTN